MNKKIKQAINSGKLIKLQDSFKKLSAEQRSKIEKKYRFIALAITIRNLRKNLRLTQEELAVKLNKKRTFISRIESGRQNITLDTLYQIAEVNSKKVLVQFC